MIPTRFWPALSSIDVHRLLMAGIGFQVALMLPSVIALGWDERLVRDVATWAKPIKFHLSLTVLMATLALVLPLTADAWRRSWTLRLSLLALVSASTFDTAYFTLQAARARASHFNNDTALEGTMYLATGVAALVILAGCFVVGMLIALSPSRPGLTGVRLGALLGLTGGAVLTFVTAGFMAAEIITESGRWIDGARSDIHGLPILGWSTTGGDLRVSHFFATHAMQVLPLVGLAADRLAPVMARPAVLAASVAGIALVAATFFQALAGQPFIRL
jgi:hypothetical protein